jgi:hypothetical protein
MTTQYTPTLKLALPVTGELSGTWGDTVNDNITSMIEQAIAGLSTINTWTANSHTLTIANGTTSESRCAMLVAATGGGAPTAAADIICPAAAKLYVLQNNTSFTVTLKTSAGTGVAVAAGDTAFLFCDGTNVNSCVTTIVNGNITGNLTVGGNATINGNTTLGNATSDTITATARFNTDLVPSTDNARDLGSAANSWKDLFIGGNATINGNTTLGNATSDTITATARFNTDLVPSTDNARDLGSAANSWKNLFIDGTATIATLNLTNALGLAYGGTGQTSATTAFNALSPITTLGDLIYGSGTNTNARLAGNTTATKNFLAQTGTGSVSAAPVWASLTTADIPALSYVSSVALALPSIMTVSGSPVTSSGTLTGTLTTQAVNAIFAGPSSGAAAAPTFRALTTTDIPALSYVSSVALALPSIMTVSGSPVTSSGTLTGTLTTQAVNAIFAGPSSGAAAAPTFRALTTTDIPALSYVTSVGWTGGIVTVATQTTTPAFTIAGTSGGIPYFNSGTTWATSAALAANSIVLGGGAGAAPATTTTGTGVVTALGNNANATGGFITADGTATLTNKNVQSRVVVIADAVSITIDADTTDIATQANTQAVGTLTVNAPTGTAVNGQKLILRLRSTNVQTFAWNAVFAGSTDIALPTTSSGATLYDYVGFIYNSTAAKWQMIAKVFGF